MKTRLCYLLFLLNLAYLPNYSNAQAIASGDHFTVAICNNNSVKSIGGDIYGELGNGTSGLSNNSSVPVSVSSLTGIIAVAAGHDHLLALKNDGTVWAWGYGGVGQLGNGTFNNSDVPVQVTSLTGITAIAAGYGHSLALKSDGTVWAWGENYYGELGNGANNDSIDIPVQVSSLSGITSIAAGQYHSLAVKNDGTVWAWGGNYYGQLGNNTITNSDIPVQVSSLTGITAVSGGGAHSLALENNGTVWSWGYNVNGQLGNGNYAQSNVPVSVTTLSGITAIAAGGQNNSYALKNDGTVWSWGYDTYGELGNGTNTNNSNVPVQVSSLTNVTAIAGGYWEGLALKNDGTLWNWGWNLYGELGTGNDSASNVPVQVTGLCTVLSVPAIDKQTLSISVYPNPNHGTFTVSMENINEKVQISIYNALGQMVCNSPVNKTTTEINMNVQATGVYLYRVLAENGAVISSGKFIVEQ